MKKTISGILSFFAIFGLANAATTIGDKKIDFVSNINENTPLILESNNSLDDAVKNIDNQLTYHYSHQSHYSHSSHQSHYSHYSSR